MFPQLSDHKNEDRTPSQRVVLALFNSNRGVGHTVRNARLLFTGDSQYLEKHLQEFVQAAEKSCFN